MVLPQDILVTKQNYISNNWSNKIVKNMIKLNIHIAIQTLTFYEVYTYHATKIISFYMQIAGI